MDIPREALRKGLALVLEGYGSGGGEPSLLHIPGSLEQSVGSSLARGAPLGGQGGREHVRGARVV